ncbi:MAG TPA: hypothetical protein DCY75_03595 [Clostridiales bacterium]|nr:hypothetical protein [Clostridiales bacterium]
MLWTGFAEWFSRTIGMFFRVITGAMTSWMPFSFMEMTVIAILIAVVCLLVTGILWLILSLYRKKSAQKAKKFFYALLKTGVAAVMIGSSLFFVNHGVNYYRHSTAENLGLKDTLKKEDVFSTLTWLVEELNMLDGEISFDESGASVCPYDFDTLAQKVKVAYDNFGSSWDFLQKTGFASKRIYLSNYLIYTHISGIYCPYTGETNINTAYPDYIVADTIAHEYSHQRGVAPENECNFLAFAVNYSSGDAYLRYAALANGFSAVARDAAKLDFDRYKTVMADCPDWLFQEYHAYKEYFKKYAENPAATVASNLNDSYLKSQGQEQGIQSYRMETELICRYYLTFFQEVS